MRHWILPLLLLVGIALPYMHLGVLPHRPVVLGALLITGTVHSGTITTAPNWLRTWRRPLFATLLVAATAYNIVQLPRLNAHAAGVRSQPLTTFEQLGRSLAVPFAQETLQLHLALRGVLENGTLIAYDHAPISPLLLHHISNVRSIERLPYNFALTPQQEHTLRKFPHRVLSHKRQQPFVLVLPMTAGDDPQTYMFFIGAHTFYFVPQMLAPE